MRISKLDTWNGAKVESAMVKWRQEGADLEKDLLRDMCTDMQADGQMATGNTESELTDRQAGRQADDVPYHTLISIYNLVI